MKSAQAFFACFLSKIITVTKAMLIILTSINQKTCAELRRSIIQFIHTTL
jgi:hypothetical protein